jgi:hypothetical protein
MQEEFGNIHEKKTRRRIREQADNSRVVGCNVSTSVVLAVGTMIYYLVPPAGARARICFFLFAWSSAGACIDNKLHCVRFAWHDLETRGMAREAVILPRIEQFSFLYLFS